MITLHIKLKLNYRRIWPILLFLHQNLTMKIKCVLYVLYVLYMCLYACRSFSLSIYICMYIHVYIYIYIYIPETRRYDEGGGCCINSKEFGVFIDEAPIGEVLKNGLVNEIIEQAAVEETVISLNR